MISVVVPAYNAADTIAHCLRALQNQRYVDPSAYEIIVVDDGSGDETARLAERSGVQLVCHRQKRGAAAARNSGIHAARGEIVCFTDADCVPEPEWVSQIIGPLDDTNIVGCKGTYATKQKEIVARFVQLEYEDKYDRLLGQRRIDFVDTYSAAYRRRVLLANGGFDEDVFYVEDQELSFRLATRGYEMVFQPTAVVYHRHSHSPAAYARKKFMIGYWKSQIIRRFPEKAVNDSHTPQVMKLQIILMALMLMTAVAAVVVPWSGLVLAAAAAVFLLTIIPFTLKAWAKDRTVGLVSPFMLAVRALALGAGYGWGLIRPKPGTGHEENTIGGINFVGKRSLDVAGGLVGLLFTMLLAPFIALAIKLDSPGPLIFRQERIGQKGRPFTVYKFRSMYAAAAAEEAPAQFLSHRSAPKPRHDPRLTAVGRILRRWSLDELPQFWNVLHGEMSLVGPRPEEPRFVATYNDWHRRRLAVKPGITGPMQINGRADLPLDDRVRLELDYIENYSLWRDVVILVKTIPVVIKGTGAR